MKAGKRVLIALFSSLVLLSCANTPRQWQFTANKGTHQNYCTSRIYLEPDNQFSGFGIEVLNTSQGYLIYLNAFGLEIKSEGQNLEGYPLVTVSLSVNNQSQEFLAFLHQGGHRILLPENASHLIIENLKENNSIEISVGNYSTTIIPDGFAKSQGKR